MAARNWESDFRYSAILASIQALQGKRFEEPQSYGCSVCVPAGKRPAEGITPGRIMLGFLVLGFSLMGSSLVVLRMGKDDVIFQIFALSLTISGIFCFALPILLDRWIVKLLIRDRYSNLNGHQGELFCAELSDVDPAKMKMTIDGDDYVLALADIDNRRLWIEGVAARYMILAEDVVQIEPFEYSNLAGAKITCWINNTELLEFAIARASFRLAAARQSTFFGIFRKPGKNKIHAACQRAIGNPLDD